MKNFLNKLENTFTALPRMIKGTFNNYIKEFYVAKAKLQNFVQTNYQLGVHHIDRCNMSDAKLRFFMVTKLEPNFALAHYHLARCHLYNLAFDKAKEELHIAISLDKKLQAAKFRLEMLNQEVRNNEPMPMQVIEEDYDNLSSKYEELIENQQEQDAQEILAKLIAKHTEGIEDPFVLDLGCGTGLMGIHLRRIVAIKSLLGIDISERMSDLAKQLVLDDHSVYNHIKKLDFHNLTSVIDKYDVITACMSFVYVNDLTKIFKNLEKVTAKRAILGLVVLKSTKDDISFDYKNGCFSFSLKYLESVFKKFNWTVIEHKELKSFSNGSHGLVFVLKK